MSHCFGSRCREHQRIMSDATCPERGCLGNHGWVDVDCDERCPDHAAEDFRKLLEQSSFGTSDGEGAPPSAHAALDRALAAHRKDPKPDKKWLAENGIAFDE